MVRISADSTCDLSSDIIKRFNIEILPLYIIIDDKELRDGVDAVSYTHLTLPTILRV